MLFLLFKIGQDHYALDTSQVAVVLSLVSLKQIPATAPWVAGVFTYQGQSVPVIDLSQLALGRPAQRRLSTRIVLVHYPAPGPDSRLLGLVLEKSSEIMRREPSEFRGSGLDHSDAPYLGPVTDDARGLIQSVRVQDLLPPEVRAQLFPAAEQ
ncbi:chemotaxis protein CheW [Collimonas sp. OK412]|jgi:chemotaxis-related protein WspB|uniref:chemotaxis protein CheW n=1 Tax=Collimonas sp. (strain OK412) TaxID=1801619 RepID=UPI0008F04D22|nr:chemotaxis protein CheW [Collimonas sp. OK412]SFB92048.1 chemotaxis-related protein WspB [Collimonas sp. OK412]